MSKVLLGFYSRKDNGQSVQVARSLGMAVTKFSDDYKDDGELSAFPV